MHWNRVGRSGSSGTVTCGEAVVVHTVVVIRRGRVRIFPKPDRILVLLGMNGPRFPVDSGAGFGVFAPDFAPTLLQLCVDIAEAVVALLQRKSIAGGRSVVGRTVLVVVIPSFVNLVLILQSCGRLDCV